MKEKGFSDFKSVLSQHTYQGQKLPKIQPEHGKPLCLLAGTDKLTKIGDP